MAAADGKRRGGGFAEKRSGIDVGGQFPYMKYRRGMNM